MVLSLNKLIKLIKVKKNSSRYGSVLKYHTVSEVYCSQPKVALC